MKKNIYIAICACFLLSCKKDSASLNSEIKATIATETKQATEYHHKGGSCIVASGSGNWAGHRTWSLVVADASWQLSLAWVGDYPGDKPVTDSTYSFEFRKGRVAGKFWANFGEGNTLTHVGSDSAFLNIKITSFDGHIINGVFDFKSYDPGLFAIGSNGSFSSVPVTIK